MVALAHFLRRDPHLHPFMFATGLECSCPVITGPGGRDLRVDEYQKTGHYKRWREDFDLLNEMGIEFVRYGIPYYRVNPAAGKYDWDFVDEVMQGLREREIVPLVDLCHFGVPDWLESFQNPAFPEHFADYAVTFARRYPWVELFTPINEIRIACEFSAFFGWWNERLTSNRAYVTALKHCARANILAEEAILGVKNRAVFVQSEATGYFHAECPRALDRAHFLNQRRFLSLDLCYGHDVSGLMYEYLLANGMTADEYHWFRRHGRAVTPACVMGNDYYATNEHMVPEGDAPIMPSGEVYGYYILTKQYFDRYQLPVMHTETNSLGGQDSVIWLRNQWLSLLRLKEDGVPLVGFTWYSLLDQVDWDSALVKDAGHVNELGLYGLDRKIHPVGEAYRNLIRAWRDILPMASRRLDTRELIGIGTSDKSSKAGASARDG
jgi:beta-glucosidase/6-phospho-beta-glucosidase/beta-galactosidase